MICDHNYVPGHRINQFLPACTTDEYVCFARYYGAFSLLH